MRPVMRSALALSLAIPFSVMADGISIGIGHDDHIDASWGSRGYVTLSTQTITAQAVDKKERLLVAGYSSTGSVVTRLLANGQPDTSFGPGGTRAITSINENIFERPNNIIPLADGGMLVVVNRLLTEPTPLLQTKVIHVSASGSVSATYGGEGRAQFDGMVRQAFRDSQGRLYLLTDGANGKLLRENVFDNIWVQPAAGDAGGAVGALHVSRAAPDGLTLGVATVSTHAIQPAVSARPGYQPLRDFSPISNLADVPNIVSINPRLPAANLVEFVALARRKDGDLMFGSPGVGSLGHMMGELLAQTTGARLRHVPYRGAGPALQGGWWKHSYKRHVLPALLGTGATPPCPLCCDPPFPPDLMPIGPCS